MTMAKREEDDKTRGAPFPALARERPPRPLWPTPMTGLFFVAAVTAVLIAFGSRRWRRARLRRLSETRIGSAPERAIHVRSYDEMDEHLRGRWCHCGGFLERIGEGTSEIGDRRFRVARLSCQECETVHPVFFDTTDLLH
jgi:hypothetical protein